ncbi:MAG: 4Fe-4S binding protein [Candidatus Thermoplasmatota archaeon]
MMRLQFQRLITQIFLFFSANLGALGVKTGFCFPFFYCHACPAASAACPLRAFEQSVDKGSFAWRLFLYPFLILGFFGITTGRAVCGWACPIGLLQRGTGRFARKLKKFRLIQTIGKHRCEQYLRYTKYGVLIGLVFATSYLLGFIFTDICPVGFLTGTVPVLILYPGKFVPNFFFPVALVIFILFIILIFVVERGWCRYFCPLGAFFAVFNKISFLHVEVHKEDCVHCHMCSLQCPMGIDVPTMHRDPECILCGKCVSTCPKKLITFERM